MPHDVFISYSQHDKPMADAVCATLEAQRIRCWIAPRDVTPGDDWAGEIVKAINACRVMVLIFSSHANQSRQVRREVQRAFERERTVIPLRVEDVAPVEGLEYYIGSVHWLDALTPPLEQHLQDMASCVARLLVPASRAAEPPEPAEAPQSQPVVPGHMASTAGQPSVEKIATNSALRQETQLRNRRVYMILVAVLGCVLAIVGGIAFTLEYPFSELDKVEADRLLVEWAVEGRDIPGWEGKGTKNPVLEEFKYAKAITIAYDLFMHETFNSKSAPSFSDPRIRVIGVVVGAPETFPSPAQGECLILLDRHQSLHRGYRLVATFWTDTVSGDLRLDCVWSKMLTGLRANVSPELHTPMGWVSGKKK